MNKHLSQIVSLLLGFSLLVDPVFVSAFEGWPPHARAVATNVYDTQAIVPVLLASLFLGMGMRHPQLFVLTAQQAPISRANRSPKRRLNQHTMRLIEPYWRVLKEELGDKGSRLYNVLIRHDLGYTEIANGKPRIVMIDDKIAHGDIQRQDVDQIWLALLRTFNRVNQGRPGWVPLITNPADPEILIGFNKVRRFIWGHESMHLWLAKNPAALPEFRRRLTGLFSQNTEIHLRSLRNSIENVYGPAHFVESRTRSQKPADEWYLEELLVQLIQEKSEFHDPEAVMATLREAGLDISDVQALSITRMAWDIHEPIIYAVEKTRTQHLSSSGPHSPQSHAISNMGIQPNDRGLTPQRALEGPAVKKSSQAHDPKALYARPLQWSEIAEQLQSWREAGLSDSDIMARYVFIGPWGDDRPNSVEQLNTFIETARADIDVHEASPYQDYVLRQMADGRILIRPKTKPAVPLSDLPESKQAAEDRMRMRLTDLRFPLIRYQPAYFSHLRLIRGSRLWVIACGRDNNGLGPAAAALGFHYIGLDRNTEDIRRARREAAMLLEHLTPMEGSLDFIDSDIHDYAPEPSSMDAVVLDSVLDDDSILGWATLRHSKIEMMDKSFRAVKLGGIIGLTTYVNLEDNAAWLVEYAKESGLDLVRETVPSDILQGSLLQCAFFRVQAKPEPAVAAWQQMLLAPLDLSLPSHPKQSILSRASSVGNPEDTIDQLVKFARELGLELRGAIVASLGLGKATELIAFAAKASEAMRIIGVEVFSEYVQAVAEQILQYRPELKDTIRLYHADARRMHRLDSNSVRLLNAVGLVLPQAAVDAVNEVVRILEPNGLATLYLDLSQDAEFREVRRVLEVAGEIIRWSHNLIIFQKAASQSATESGKSFDVKSWIPFLIGTATIASVMRWLGTGGADTALLVPVFLLKRNLIHARIPENHATLLRAA